MSIVLLYLLLSNLLFEDVEETIKEIRKANAFYNIQMDVSFYVAEWEKIKKEGIGENILKFKEKLDYEFNIALRKKYNQILKNIEENLSFFGDENKIIFYKNYQKELEERIENKASLKNLNYEILEKLKNIQKDFNDNCLMYFHNAENMRDLSRKLEYYCKILKEPCIFFFELKDNAFTELKKEKLNFLSNLKEGKNLEEMAYISNLFFTCFEGDKDFIDEISKLREEILTEIKINIKRENCADIEKYLKILKIIRENFENYENLISLCLQKNAPKAEEITLENYAKKPTKEFRDEDKTLKAPYIILDIWQSAWGDFSDLQLLLDYIKNNKISEINLNIGKEITEKQETQKRAREILKNLVPKLYQAGANKVNLLYAELNYPIENYAKFLSENKDLGIDKIVDDSEFTDINMEKYLINSYNVKKFGLKYSIFITIEKEGNSGVSDKTRYYFIKEADEVILMSYFSCNFEEQKEWLFPYLKYADELGRKNKVRIALLLGGKSVGREKSCEGIGEKAFSDLILKLHNWALNFSSYDGIVIETNRKIPSFNISNNYAKIEKD